MGVNEIVATRNDALRASIPAITPPNLLVITAGVQALGPERVAEALGIVREFNEFKHSNDPYGEHDFGSFELAGQKLFWKIDNYAGQEGYELVLTILLAEEY